MEQNIYHPKTIQSHVDLNLRNQITILTVSPQKYSIITFYKVYKISTYALLATKYKAKKLTAHNHRKL